MTLSVADHGNCLYRNRLSLIDQRCHLLSEFGGTKTLWLCCCPTQLFLPGPLQIRRRKLEFCSPHTYCQKSYAWAGNRTPVSRVAGKNSTTELLMQYANCEATQIWRWRRANVTLSRPANIMQLHTNQAWNSHVSFHCGELLPEIKWATEQG